jgi:hypothetical protein
MDDLCTLSRTLHTLLTRAAPTCLPPCSPRLVLPSPPRIPPVITETKVLDLLPRARSRAPDLRTYVLLSA